MKKIARDRLIAALKPFAEYGVVYGDKHDPNGSVWDQVPDDTTALRGTCDQHRVTVGDLREAARLYYANGGEPITPEQIK